MNIYCKNCILTMPNGVSPTPRIGLESSRYSTEEWISLMKYV